MKNVTFALDVVATSAAAVSLLLWSQDEGGWSCDWSCDGPGGGEGGEGSVPAPGHQEEGVNHPHTRDTMPCSWGKHDMRCSLYVDMRGQDVGIGYSWAAMTQYIVEEDEEGLCGSHTP